MKMFADVRRDWQQWQSKQNRHIHQQEAKEGFQNDPVCPRGLFSSKPVREREGLLSQSVPRGNAFPEAVLCVDSGALVLTRLNSTSRIKAGSVSEGTISGFFSAWPLIYFLQPYGEKYLRRFTFVQPEMDNMGLQKFS